MAGMKDAYFDYKAGNGPRNPDDFIEQVAAEASLWSSGLWKLEAVQDYLKRINAEPCGMQTARIREYDEGHYVEFEVTVKFDPTSDEENFIKVHCVGAASGREIEFTPTPDELKTIYDARNAIEWPTLQPLSLGDSRNLVDRKTGLTDEWPKGNLKKGLGFPKYAEGSYVNLGDITDVDTTDNVTLTPVIDFNGMLAAIQTRIDFDDGRKICQVFAPFSDGRWYAESGRLPLVGLPLLAARRGLSDVVIFEGPKDQRRALKVSDPDRYGANEKEREELRSDPWSGFLKDKVVLSYLRGSGGVRVTDWTPINVRNVKSVTVICDNDDVGKGAAYRISEGLCLTNVPVGAIGQYPRSFPKGWGYGDGFKMVEAEERKMTSRGDAVRDELDWRLPETMVRDVTWLTYPYDDYDKDGNLVIKWAVRSGKPYGWAYLADAHGFVDTRSARSKVFTPGKFEKQFHPRKHKQAMGMAVQGTITSNYLMNFDGEEFVPENDDLVVAGPNGTRMLNRWKRAKLTPVEPTKKEMLVFHKFLIAAIPDKFERAMVRRSLATQIAHPARKGPSNFMLSTMQGTGKGFLMNAILKPLVNPDHYVTIAGDRMETNFNALLANRTTVFVDEGGDFKSTLYDLLKMLGSENEFTVEKKGIDATNHNNHMTLNVASNKGMSMRIDVVDRRVMVTYFRNSPIPEKYITRMLHWLRNENGYRKLYWWALNYTGSYSDGSPVELDLKKDEVPAENYRSGELVLSLTPAYFKDKEHAHYTLAKRNLLRKQIGKFANVFLSYLEDLIVDDPKAVFYLSFDALYEAVLDHDKLRNEKNVPTKATMLRNVTRAGYWQVQMVKGGEGSRGKKTMLDLYRPYPPNDPQISSSEVTDDKKQGKRMVPLFSPAAVEYLLSVGGCRIVDDKSRLIMPKGDSLPNMIALLKAYEDRENEGVDDPKKKTSVRHKVEKSEVNPL